MSLHSQTSIENELRAANEAYRAGNLSAAQARVEKLLESYPNRAEVLLAKGVMQISGGDLGGGLDSLTLCLKAGPNNAEALAWAAHAALYSHRFAEAEGFARRFTAAAGGNPRSHFLLASALRGLGRIEEALKSVDQALAIKPDDTDSLVLKARLLKEWKLPALAIEFYRKAMAIRPTPPAAVDLATMLLRDGRRQEALDLLGEVLPLIRIEHQPHALMARAYTELGRFEEAEDSWSLAAQYDHDPDEVVQIRASAEIAIGRFEVAEQILSDAIQRGKDPDAYFAILTRGRTMKEADLPLIGRMEALSRGELPPARLASLHFALGKCFDDLKDYEKATVHFDDANRINYETHPERQNFRPEDASAFVDFMIDKFNIDYVCELAELGRPSELPLFIVGMVRSGTTLTESILGAHSLVKSGGEQSFWLDRTLELFYSGAGLEFKEALALQFGAEYLSSIDPGDDSIRYVTDKLPANMDRAAMLHALYPNAKIVHLKRHPVDTLLSIWMTPGAAANAEWASNRENLVFGYREYLRLFEHYRSVIPEDRFTTIHYEELTSRRDETIRSMLQFVGLEPEPLCFTPEKSSRAVLTPSATQVRQPIHERSQARWKNYEPWLGPFAELLSGR